MKFDIWGFFETLWRKFKFRQGLIRIPGTLLRGLCNYVIISRSVLLRQKNVSDKICRGTQNTILCSINFFPRKLCHLWDNLQRYGTARQIAIQYAACALHAGYLRLQKHSCLILFASPRQKWSRERAFNWRYSYIAYLVFLAYSFYLLTGKLRKVRSCFFRGILGRLFTRF